MTRIELPPLDHSQKSIGKAFGVEEERLKEILRQANDKLREISESGEDTPISKILEIGLSCTDTVSEGVLICFGLGSQQGFMQATELSIDDKLSGMFKSKPGESPEE